jgi:hypothetical protein
MPDPDARPDGADGVTQFGDTEGDVADDSAEVTSRPAGGTDNPAMADRDSTTGTTPNSEFVGRVAGADATDVGESGAEARAAAGDTGPA